MKVYRFKVEDGQLFYGAKQEPNDGLTGIHLSGWSVLTDPSLNDEEWTVAFNILGPAMTNEFMRGNEDGVERIINEYTRLVEGDHHEITYMTALHDTASKFTHILRVKFYLLRELMSKGVPLEAAENESYVYELKPSFAKVPYYHLMAVVESINILRSNKKVR